METTLSIITSVATNLPAGKTLYVHVNAVQGVIVVDVDHKHLVWKESVPELINAEIWRVNRMASLIADKLRHLCPAYAVTEVTTH